MKSAIIIIVAIVCSTVAVFGILFVMSDSNGNVKIPIKEITAPIKNLNKPLCATITDEEWDINEKYNKSIPKNSEPSQEQLEQLGKTWRELIAKFDANNCLDTMGEWICSADHIENPYAVSKIYVERLHPTKNLMSGYEDYCKQK